MSVSIKVAIRWQVGEDAMDGTYCYPLGGHRPRGGGRI